jgi:hypothetical protein
MKSYYDCADIPVPPGWFPQKCIDLVETCPYGTVARDGSNGRRCLTIRAKRFTKPQSWTYPDAYGNCQTGKRVYVGPQDWFGMHPEYACPDLAEAKAQCGDGYKLMWSPYFKEYGCYASDVNVPRHEWNLYEPTDEGFAQTVPVTGGKKASRVIVSRGQPEDVFTITAPRRGTLVQGVAPESVMYSKVAKTQATASAPAPDVWQVATIEEPKQPYSNYTTLSSGRFAQTEMLPSAQRAKRVSAAAQPSVVSGTATPTATEQIAASGTPVVVAPSGTTAKAASSALRRAPAKTVVAVPCRLVAENGKCQRGYRLYKKAGVSCCRRAPAQKRLVVVTKRRVVVKRRCKVGYKKRGKKCVRAKKN